MIDFMMLQNLFCLPLMIIHFHQLILIRYPMQYIPNIKYFCTKIVPFVDFYKKQIDYFNKTVHDILTKEIPLILANFPKNRKEKRGIITLLVAGLIRSVYGGISSYLHNKRQKALKKAFVAMKNQVNLERNKLFHLEDSMVIYSIYNSDTLEKLINTVHKMHNKTTWSEKLFAGKLNNWYQWYLSEDRAVHYAINSILYIITLRGKYAKMHENFISQLKMYPNVIRVLAKGYLPVSLLPPTKLQEILNKVKKTPQITNPDCEIVIKSLHLYYEMTLVTFGINEERNLIVQFLVFIQPYIQQQLILYQIETVPVPIIELNKQAHSYTHLQVDMPYIALNSETYISIRYQELRLYKNIGYEFCCKEFFVVKHKSKCSCESAIYFNLGSEIINEDCNFVYYFNKTDIKPAVLDGGNEIILANWPNNKHIECNINNDIPVNIPSFPYVLVSQSVLCNCEIEVENNF